MRTRGIFKRGTVYWVRYAGPDGRILRESARTRSLKEAEYLLTCRKKEVAEGKTPARPTRSYTFGELAREYMVWAERQRSFQKSKSYRLKQLVKVFGNYPLINITPKLVEQFQTERLKRNKPAGVNRLVSILKHCLRKGVDWEMSPEDTLKRIRAVNPIPEIQHRLRYLSEEECGALIESCNSHLKPIVITALHTGMRRGEVLGLKWENIDLTHGFILLGKTKTGEKREIPINPTLRTVLESIPHSLESEYVFVDRNGNPYKEVRKSFETACRRAGIHDFRFHDLRHTFASHLVMAGIDLPTVKELLGHRDITTTLRYAHLSPSHKVKALRVLNERLGMGDKKHGCTDTKTDTVGGDKEGLVSPKSSEDWHPQQGSNLRPLAPEASALFN